MSLADIVFLSIVGLFMGLSVYGVVAVSSHQQQLDQETDDEE